ncbi:hypothetical protein NEOLEDRAFT_1036564, partial [Neolentinus lepideus HHB14362 ss-1]
GTSRYLRQEFRELEILDHITDLRYHGILPAHIEGHQRNTLVQAYQMWKQNECPGNMHTAIQWDESNPFDLLELVENEIWNAIKPKKIEVDQMHPVTKLPGQDIYHKPPVLRPTTTTIHHEDTTLAKEFIPSQNQVRHQIPQGFIWDSTYSCAYDALLMILLNIWQDNPNKWSKQLNINSHMESIIEGFESIQSGETSM